MVNIDTFFISGISHYNFDGCLKIYPKDQGEFYRFMSFDEKEFAISKDNIDNFVSMVNSGISFTNSYNSFLK